MAHNRCMLDKQDYTHSFTPAHAQAYAPKHSHALNGADTHTDKYVILIAFHGKNISRASQCYVIRTLLVFLEHKQINGSANNTLRDVPQRL